MKSSSSSRASCKSVSVTRCIADFTWSYTVINRVANNNNDNNNTNTQDVLRILASRAPRVNGRLRDKKTLLLPFLSFCLLVSRISCFRFLGKDTAIPLDLSGEAPGRPSNNLDVEVFGVGGFLTHGDYALDTDADFFAVVEHRLVLASARSEGKRLLQAGARSFWAPASLEGGHVGRAGVGVVSLRGAPISLPTIATFFF